MLSTSELVKEAKELLKKLIRTESFSGTEDKTADIIAHFFNRHGVKHIRKNNNIIARNLHFDSVKPTLLLNSHHDTVKVVNGWTFDPFGGQEEDGKIYGLGANDAGGCLVSLIATFIYFYKSSLKFNIILAATAEEENFGSKGVKSLIDSELKDVDFGIVGEPTNMELGVAEKGLIVIDATAQGKAGHAARQEGENAIYKALKDVDAIQNMKFERVSDLLGPNVISVTQINAGVQHNVVPDQCTFVIDLRVNECYTLQEAFTEVEKICESSLKARSFNNNSSGISLEHPLVQAGKKIGLSLFGSSTLSDQANMPFPTVKIGPGFSERSHTADEFIGLSELEQGIEKYISLIENIEV